MKLLKKVLLSSLIAFVPLHWYMTSKFANLWVCLYWCIMYSVLILLVWAIDYLEQKNNKLIQKTKDEVKKESLEIDETIYSLTEVMKEYYLNHPGAPIGLETSIILQNMEENPGRWNEAAQRVSYKRALKAGLIK